MKRDLELIKSILEKIESFDDLYRPFSHEEAEMFFVADEITLRHHFSLLVDHQLVSKVDYNSGGMTVYGLTWRGYDFLDDAQNPTVWEAAKKIAGKASISTFMVALKSGAAEAVAVAVRNALGSG